MKILDLIIVGSVTFVSEMHGMEQQRLGKHCCTAEKHPEVKPAMPMNEKPAAELDPKRYVEFMMQLAEADEKLLAKIQQNPDDYPGAKIFLQKFLSNGSKRDLK